MPSSFSRFLDESELTRIREMYLESLDALDDEDEDDAPAAPTDGGQPSGEVAGR